MTSRKSSIGNYHNQNYQNYQRFLLVLLVLIGITTSLHAQSKQQLEKDKAQVEQEIKRLNNDLVKARKNSKAGQKELNLLEQGKDRDGEIYAQDTGWLRESDLLIAECTNPSLGVGYELAYAERFGKPCYLFYNKTRTQLSAMLTGDPYFSIFSYETEDELFAALERVISDVLEFDPQ